MVSTPAIQQQRLGEYRRSLKIIKKDTLRCTTSVSIGDDGRSTLGLFS
jgi:hypothetical protein